MSDREYPGYVQIMPEDGSLRPATDANWKEANEQRRKMKMSDTTHEPAPVTTEKPAVPVTTRVIQDLRDKSEAGVEKYGVPLHTFNGRNPLRDAYQEALDLAQYLKQALMEQDIESGADALWLTDADLALQNQHYKDLMQIKGLEGYVTELKRDLSRLEVTTSRKEQELQNDVEGLQKYARGANELNAQLQKDAVRFAEERDEALRELSGTQAQVAELTDDIRLALSSWNILAAGAPGNQTDANRFISKLEGKYLD